MRAGPWWPLAGVLGVAGTAWILRCALRCAARFTWLGVAALGLAYAVVLAGNLAPVDQWAALYGALLLGVAELAHAAAGVPDLDVADPASRGRYASAAMVAVAAGFGVAALMLAAAGSGGTGGAEITALGGACAAAALALLATTARRAAS